MSVVVKHEIIESIKNGDLKFKPALDSLQFRPHAIDLRLGFSFRIPKRVFNADKNKEGRSATLKPGQFIDILPGESVIGFTLEEVDIKSNTLMGILYPRSSVNRRGLAVDLTGIVDSGYKGHLMMPIHNTTDMQVIRLYPGERICQLVFERLEQPVRDGYQGRYSSQKHKGYLPETEAREIELIRAGKIKDIKKEFSASK
jgi:dCTP deaminase